MPARTRTNTQTHAHFVSRTHAQHMDTRADLSILLFLKFISSIIPTIEYDFTVNFDTGAARR